MNEPGARRAQASDLPALRELASAFYREYGFDTAPQVLEANLAVLLDTGSAHVAVIDDVGQLLAFAITTTSFGLENGLIAELEDLYVTPAARGLRHGRRLPREQRGLVPRPRLQPPRDRHRWRPRTATPAQLLSPGRVSPTRASCSASHYKDRPAHTDQAVRPRSRKAHTSRTTIERTPPARSPRLSIRRDVRLPDTHGATASDGVNSRSTGHEEGPGFPDASGRRVIG